MSPKVLLPSVKQDQLTMDEMDNNLLSVDSRIWNVTDKRHGGATGDGVTNDTTAIASTIAAAASEYASSGVVQVVYLPQGTFLVDEVILKSGVWLKGSGWGTRLLANQNKPVVKAGPDGNVINVLVSAGLFDLMIDGNLRNKAAWSTGSAAGTVGGVNLACQENSNSSIIVDKVYIYDTRCDGLRAVNIMCTIGHIKVSSCGLNAELGCGVRLVKCPRSYISRLDAAAIRGLSGLVVDSCNNLIVDWLSVHGASGAGVVVDKSVHTKLMSGDIGECASSCVSIISGDTDETTSKHTFIGAVILDGGGSTTIPVISAAKTKNTHLNATFISNAAMGIEFSGGSTYGGHRLIDVQFDGVTTAVGSDNSYVERVPAAAQGTLEVTVPSTTLAATAATSYELDIPCNRAYGVRVAINGLVGGQLVKLEIFGNKEGTTLTDKMYIGNFKSDDSVDYAQAWYYRDLAGLGKMRVQLTNTGGEAVTVTATITIEPF